MLNFCSLLWFQNHPLRTSLTVAMSAAPTSSTTAPGSPLGGRFHSSGPLEAVASRSVEVAAQPNSMDIIRWPGATHPSSTAPPNASGPGPVTSQHLPEQIRECIESCSPDKLFLQGALHMFHKDMSTIITMNIIITIIIITIQHKISEKVGNVKWVTSSKVAYIFFM